jgi:hypothetical protein
LANTTRRPRTISSGSSTASRGQALSGSGGRPVGSILRSGARAGGDRGRDQDRRLSPPANKANSAPAMLAPRPSPAQPRARPRPRPPAPARTSSLPSRCPLPG